MKFVAIAAVSAALLSPAVLAAQKADSIPITIQDAVHRALTVGDEVRSAAAQVDVAGAQVSIARSAGLPQVRLSGTQSHVYESARAQAVGSIFNQPNTYGANASLSQPLFQGGRVVAGTRSATRLREAAEADEAETKAQVALDVQRAYLQALFAKRVAEIQDTGVALAGQRVRQSQQFEAAGRAARYDVLRARVEQANLEPQVIQAHSDVDVSLLELKRLINLPATAPLKLVSGIDTVALGDLVARVSNAPMQGNRPALRSAELVVEARRNAITVARADLLPSISVNGVLGAQAFPLSGLPQARGRLDVVPCPAGSPDTRVCTQQNGGWFGDKSLGLTISWPIFDGLRAKSAVDLASAQERLAELQLAQTRERVELDVTRARADLARAQALYAARKQNAQEANEAFRLATLRYSRGLGTQLEVSDAQLALTTAQTNEARAIFDLYLSAASLARALGQPVPFPDQPWAPGSQPR
jgi:outer membrane protein TolC